MVEARSKSSVIAWPFDANICTKNHSGQIPQAVDIDYGADLVLQNVSEAFKVIRLVRLPVIVNLV